MKRSTGFLVTAALMAVAGILMAVALARYVNRLPDDWVGIGLFSAAMIGFLIALVGFLVRWREERRREEEQPPTG